MEMEKMKVLEMMKKELKEMGVDSWGLFKVHSASSSLSPDGSHKSSCAIIGVDTTLLLLISNYFNV